MNGLLSASTTYQKNEESDRQKKKKHLEVAGYRAVLADKLRKETGLTEKGSRFSSRKGQTISRKETL